MSEQNEKVVKVAEVHELSPGKGKLVELNGNRILLIQLKDGYYAIDDTCTHEEESLSGGFIEGNEIECPKHGARFEIQTGDALCFPAAVGLSTYEVRVDAKDIKLNLSNRGSRR